MKLEQAARQALVALEDVMADFDGSWALADTAITALRKALYHSADDGKMIGCAYCNNPLFAGTKCNNCGRVTLAEQAEPMTDTELINANCRYTTPLMAGQAEQEPIGYVIEDNDYEGSKIWVEPINGCFLPVYLAPVRTKDLSDEEIVSLAKQINGIYYDCDCVFARAVIAADREKNK